MKPHEWGTHGGSLTGQLLAAAGGAGTAGAGAAAVGTAASAGVASAGETAGAAAESVAVAAGAMRCRRRGSCVAGLPGAGFERQEIVAGLAEIERLVALLFLEVRVGFAPDDPALQ